MPDRPNTPFVLIIRDGWGQNPNYHHRAFNAIELAETPVANRLMVDYPTTLIKTSGEDVGLPEGTTGNSEVGHQNIGAGRIVLQEHMRISDAVRRGRFFKNEVLIEAINHAKASGGAMHLMGIASDAGVHGVLYHLYACLELCKRMQCDNVLVHLFTDGRDTGPYTGIDFVAQVEAMMGQLGVGRVASIIGRYWAMDRDNRWERVNRAYACLTGYHAKEQEVRHAASANEAIQWFYDHPLDSSRQGDEFILPAMIGADANACEAGRIHSGDSVFFYNYRGDRPRELTRAFVFDDFHGHVPPSPDTGEKGFDRGDKLDLFYATMCQYDTRLDPFVHVAYPRPPRMLDIAGDYLSKKGYRQFRGAETEKYPHVTFFFNDYREDPFEDERRKIVQSPKVTTYDQQPEMSAEELCESVLERLNAPDGEDFFVVNFANPDMVGHTGKLDAAIAAVEMTDRCVGRIVEAALAHKGSLIITADHGNAEQMYNPVTDSPHTSHTLYDVPLIVVGEAFKGRPLREGGRLADILPTALEMINLPQPELMTGQSLLLPADPNQASEG